MEDRWIDVHFEFPEVGEIVLIYTRYKIVLGGKVKLVTVQPAYRTKSDKFILFMPVYGDPNAFDDSQVSHWMPLPDPPKTLENE